jgi:hypothetical protein
MSAHLLAPKPPRRLHPPVWASAPWDDGGAPGNQGKVQPWHQERLAVVYVRQSPPQQVLEHQESPGVDPAAVWADGPGRGMG